MEALQEQKKHLDAARAASLATVLQGMFATAVAFAALVVAPQATAARIAFALVAAIPLLLSLRTRSRASKARALAGEASERALQAAAEEAAGEGATAKEVAKKLGIEPARAEKILTASAATDRVRIDVHDESAEVVYRTEEEFSSDGDDEAASPHQHRR